jgi:hypothetical protein
MDVRRRAIAHRWYDLPGSLRARWLVHHRLDVDPAVGESNGVALSGADRAGHFLASCLHRFGVTLSSCSAIVFFCFLFFIER